MKTTILLSLVLGGGTLFAAPCTNTTLDNYIGNGFTCTIDQFTFKNFFFNVVTSSGIAPIAASAISVLPAVTATPNGDLLGLTFNSTGFRVGAGQAVTYDIRYNVDPQPDIIIEATDQLGTNTPVAPGTADVLTKLCVGGQWLGTTPSCDVTGGSQALTVFHHGTPTGNQLSSFITFAGVSRIGWDNYISLNGGAGGSSSITGITNTTYTVPEPASVFLFLSGAALLGARRLRPKVG